MALTPGESDRLLLFLQGQLARARRDRGLLLNVPEATAYIADAVCEWARDGLDLPTVRERARHLLSVDDVLPGVPDLLADVRVEARFDDGPRLVVVNDPFDVASEGDTNLSSRAPEKTAEIAITNESTTPIAVSSHIHLAEVNPRLRLDRSTAFGCRLAVPAGSTVWIEPGATVTVPVTPVRGQRLVHGNTGVVDGPLDDPQVRQHALTALRECGYLDIVEGQPVNSLPSAEHAVGALMAQRQGRA